MAVYPTRERMENGYAWLMAQEVHTILHDPRWKSEADRVRRMADKIGDHGMAERLKAWIGAVDDARTSKNLPIRRRRAHGQEEDTEISFPRKDKQQIGTGTSRKYFHRAQRTRAQPQGAHKKDQTG